MMIALMTYELYDGTAVLLLYKYGHVMLFGEGRRAT